MTRRRIVLELDATTSGTTCGNCEYVRQWPRQTAQRRSGMPQSPTSSGCSEV